MRRVIIIFCFLALFVSECRLSDSDDYEDDDEEEPPECRTNIQILDGTRGVLKSPGYDAGKYASNLFCSWKSHFQEGKYVQFRFLDLDIEISENCDNDKVEITGTNDTYIKYCGSTVPPVLTTSTDQLIFVHFATDELYEFRGFRLEYEILDHPPTCAEGEFMCSTGKCIPKTGLCNFVDDCGDGSDEEKCDYETTIPRECGIAEEEKRRVKKIVGGQAAVPNSWPWQVNLQRSNAFPSGHFCGGALINNLWFLTAGHCLNSGDSTNLKFLFGKHYRFNSTTKEMIRYDRKICIHPEFRNDDGLQNDIALVKLNAPVWFTHAVSPVCLPEKGKELSNETFVYVTGWGKTFGSGHHDELKQAMLPVINQSTCKSMLSHGKYQDLDLEDDSFCIGSKTGKNAPCFGDSGGPVVQKVNGKWYLYGLVSWGPDICSISTEPNICSKVSRFVDWIHAQIDADFHHQPMQCFQREKY